MAMSTTEDFKAIIFACPTALGLKPELSATAVSPPTKDLSQVAD